MEQQTQLRATLGSGVDNAVDSQQDGSQCLKLQDEVEVELGHIY